MKNHCCLKIKYDPRDFQLGDGKIKLKGFGNPDWTSNYHFKERQSFDGFDTDSCVIFGFQKSYDAQMDALIQAGQLPQSLIDFFTTNGYMDSVNSIDNKPHFHTSERFTALLTGNGFSGNAAQDPCNVVRKYGCIPWTDWPFDSTITEDHYFDKPPQTLYDKGALFLSMMGGANHCQYHWVHQGKDTARSLMDSARRTAPLMLGVAATDGWNQDTPTPPAIGTPPNHLVDNINVASQGETISDNYPPFIKYQPTDYAIPQTFQMIVQYIPPPPPIPPTPISTVQQNPKGWSAWLQSVSNWLQNWLERLTPLGQARLQGAKRSDKWPEVRKKFLALNPECKVCSTKENLEAHHVQVFHLHPDRELDFSNLIALCRTHHFEWGHYFNWSSWNENVRADVATFNAKVKGRP